MTSDGEEGGEDGETVCKDEETVQSNDTLRSISLGKK